MQLLDSRVSLAAIYVAVAAGLVLAVSASLAQPAAPGLPVVGVGVFVTLCIATLMMTFRREATARVGLKRR
jgi:hypothetical protein